jgi:hypothetical protein
MIQAFTTTLDCTGVSIPLPLFYEILPGGEPAAQIQRRIAAGDEEAHDAVRCIIDPIRESEIALPARVSPTERYLGHDWPDPKPLPHPE